MTRRLIRADGLGVPLLLDAVLKVFPLDSYVKSPVGLMEKVPGDGIVTPTIWSEYKKIIKKNDKKADTEFIERFLFYERAKKAYAIVTTGESALYTNIILKKESLHYRTESTKLEI